MSTGQSLMTMLAMMLLSVMVLNFVRTSEAVSNSLDYDRFRLESQSVMTSHIEQLSQFYFDEASTDTTNRKALADMTSPLSLGFEGNDNLDPDDIDDLNGIAVSDTGISGVIYNVNYSVDYVTMTNNRIAHSSSRQFHKRIQLAVSDSYTPPLIYHYNDEDEKVRDTLRIAVVISYWFYN
jgi:hypothetical protein